MGRKFGHLRMNRSTGLALREAMRPFALGDEEKSELPALCKRLYLAIYELEADEDLAEVQLEVSSHDCLMVNNFISQEEGEWAADLLHQTRQALYERETGREAIKLAPRSKLSGLLEGVRTDPDA